MGNGQCACLINHSKLHLDPASVEQLQSILEEVYVWCVFLLHFMMLKDVIYYVLCCYTFISFHNCTMQSVKSRNYGYCWNITLKSKYPSSTFNCTQVCKGFFLAFEIDLWKSRASGDFFIKVTLMPKLFLKKTDVKLTPAFWNILLEIFDKFSWFYLKQVKCQLSHVNFQCN